MATLANSFPQNSSVAVIIPRTPGGGPISVTYSQLSSQISQIQRKLASLGIRRGTAVSIALPNSLEFVVSFLATSWQRGIAAPLNPDYKQSEFEFYIHDLNSTLTIVPRGAVERNSPVVRAARKFQAAIAECYLDGKNIVLDLKEIGKLKDVGGSPLEMARPSDVAMVLHTSGTTGRPKVVPLTHTNMTTTMRNIRNSYDLNNKDRTLLVMPLFHVHGLMAGLLSPLGSGGSVIIPTRFSAKEFWNDFITHKANWWTAVPTIHQILLKNPIPNPRPQIRFIRSCSSPLSPKTFHELEKTFGTPVVEAYAMTEAAHQMSSNPLPPAKRLPGSVGIGQGVQVKIFDQDGVEKAIGEEGEICVRGENLTSGYLNNPKANKSSFTTGNFFRTGDQGKLDEDGYIFITGRIKELINKGGEKISPIELDNTILRHPAVAEAVSFATVDEHYGQDVGVAIVLKGQQTLSPQELRDWLSTRVAKFKLPKKIYFTDAMPKTATGKVQRCVVASHMLKKEEPRAQL